MDLPRASYEAAVVPEPPEEASASGFKKPPEEAFEQIPEMEKALHGKPSREDPFFQSNGPIDVICGECGWTAMEEMNPKQVQTLLFECPRCDSWNAVLSIPALESFIHELQSSSPSAEDVDQFRVLLAEAQERPHPSEELAIRIENELPEFSWVNDLIVPSDAGEFWTMVCALFAFLQWYQGRGDSEQGALDVLRNYLADADNDS